MLNLTIYSKYTIITNGIGPALPDFKFKPLQNLVTRNTCMQQPLAYIFQTLFQHEIFVITPTLNAGSCRHVMLVMATR
jgi:hypothetical protein